MCPICLKGRRRRREIQGRGHLGRIVGKIHRFEQNIHQIVCSCATDRDAVRGNVPEEFRQKLYRDYLNGNGYGDGCKGVPFRSNIQKGVNVIRQHLVVRDRDQERESYFYQNMKDDRLRVSAPYDDRHDSNTDRNY